MIRASFIRIKFGTRLGSVSFFKRRFLPSRKWEKADEFRLSDKNLQGLFNNEIAAVRVLGFASEEECDGLANAVDAMRMETIKESVKNGEVSIVDQKGFHENQEKFYQPFEGAVSRIGIAQSEFSAEAQEKDEYFSRTADAELQRGKIISAGGFDPLTRFMNLLRENCGLGTVSIATEDGKSYFAGMIRSASSGVWAHFDFAPFHASPKWTIGQVESQLTWNLYLTQPIGGETVVYDCQWIPEYETLKRQELSQPYCNDMLHAGVSRISLPVIKGDVVIFNTRNFHEVWPIDLTSKRYTFGSFVGKFRNGNIILWS